MSQDKIIFEDCHWVHEVIVDLVPGYRRRRKFPCTEESITGT